MSEKNINLLQSAHNIYYSKTRNVSLEVEMNSSVGARWWFSLPVPTVNESMIKSLSWSSYIISGINLQLINPAMNANARHLDERCCPPNQMSEDHLAFYLTPTESLLTFPHFKDFVLRSGAKPLSCGWNVSCCSYPSSLSTFIIFNSVHKAAGLNSKESEVTFC